MLPHHDRVGPPDLGEGKECTTLLGQWHATALFWRPQVALFVNDTTLLPVLMPPAPAATLLARFPDHLASALTAHGASDTIIDEELRRMRDRRLAKTSDRSVIGVMNEFSRLAEIHRGGSPAPDLPGLATRLAATPCSPLYGRHTSPDRELNALLHSITPAN